MALVTLSGVISATDLNTNFNDKRAALNASNIVAGKCFQYDIRNMREGGTGLTSATVEGYRTIDFTPPDDLLLVTVGLSYVQADATSRTISLALTVRTDPLATAAEVISVQRYLGDQTISVSVTGASAAEHTATRYVPTVPVVLIKGVAYRMQLSSTAATAIDTAYGFVLARQFKRYR